MKDLEVGENKGLLPSHDHSFDLLLFLNQVVVIVTCRIKW